MSGPTETRCVDIKDKFICPDYAAFTHVCTPGFVCDTSNPGKCKQTTTAALHSESRDAAPTPEPPKPKKKGWFSK